MNALEELDNLNNLVPQELRLALQNCEAMDEIAAEARQRAYAARLQVCKDCPHPAQFVVSYYKGPSFEGRVCRLCGLHEGHPFGGYKRLTTLSYTDDHNQRVEFDVAMSYRTLRVEELTEPQVWDGSVVGGDGKTTFVGQ